ncbi:conserved hypothetical protein [Neospora caninum Liverpool]|uniref:histone acetyltransferase n=1 Tax=Neospora caninum (strain Liverpool) TaxID=572307 RepID=F0V744_NEOCL|nr:conserved hypothetical protein [Neospora caninum Liverpool]CBZ49535.1 conserved hypothetical protein [Neospora caninum Liverpool]CEL64114.1 TPA: histone lysine acetyltransferase HAT1 [Neospora caninum Liverpool]|eukprot:XP_003879570.1 conserved hypothetical protein [Neospora caninum Liverpool]
MPRESPAGLSRQLLSSPVAQDSPAHGAALPSLNALQVVRFHPVVHDADLFSPSEEEAFSPLFCHHFFKESESVSGFDELAIDIFFAPDTFDAYICVKGVISPKARDPSAVHSALRRDLFESVRFPGGLATSAEDFLASVKKNRALFSPPGRVVAERLLSTRRVANRETRERKTPARTERDAAPATEEADANSEVEEAVKLQLRECSFDVEEADPFLLLHRRVEWFLHWFIESASAIHTDSQWRVILPYLVTERRRARAPETRPQDGAEVGAERKKTKSPREKRLGRKPEETDDSRRDPQPHHLHVGLSQKAGEKCAEVAQRFEKHWAAEHAARSQPQGGGASGGVGPDERDEEKSSRRRASTSEAGDGAKKQKVCAGALAETREDGFSVLPVFAVYGQPESAGELKRENCTNGARKEGHAQGCPRKAKAGEDGEELHAEKREEAPARTKKEVRAEPVRYHLAGIATTYTFYAVTGFRRRISQFMVFPHVQRQVEDPASSFSQLRDVASLKLLIDLGVLPRALLYPPAAEETQEEEERRKMLICPQRLTKLVKETTKQATRMSEILQLGQQLPHPLPPPPLDSEDLEHRRDWRRALHNAPQDASSSASSPRSANLSRPGGAREGEAKPEEKSGFLPCPGASPAGSGKKGGEAQSRAGEDDCCKEIRVKVKRRLKRENLHWLVDIPVAQQKAELQQLWLQLYVKYYR